MAIRNATFSVPETDDGNEIEGNAAKSKNPLSPGSRPLIKGNSETSLLAPSNRNKTPSATQQPQEIFNKHGIQVVDDYYWLRDKEKVNQNRVLKYLEEENAYADLKMKHAEELQNGLYNEFVSRNLSGERYASRMIDDYYYYSRLDVEAQYKVHCRRFESPTEGEETVILDENEEAQGEDYFHLGSFEVSPDHNLLAYAVDTQGSEKFTLRFKSLTKLTWLEDEIHPVSGSACWAADSKTLFYTKVDEKGRANKLYKHVIEKNELDGSDDELIFEEDEPAFSLDIRTTNNNKYFLLIVESNTTNEVWYLPTAKPNDKFKLITPREPDVLYTVDNHGGYFYIMTSEGRAKNNKVVKAPIDEPGNKENWEEVLSHRDEIFLERIDLFRHHFVAWEWENGLQKIRVQDLSDLEVHYVPLAEGLYTIIPGEEDEIITGRQTFNSNILRFSYTSFLQPTVVYDYDMDNCRKRKLHEPQVAGFVKDQYHQKRIFAMAPDGTMIPISLVYKISLKNSAGGNPLVLYGYGAYGAKTSPTFSAPLLSILDRGFIYAIAHVRGDGIMGRDWYEQGKLLNKKTTFTDFIACAEHLIFEGHTTADKLSIYGTSAGGTLVCAAANMRPDLFHCVIADVPFVDVFGTLIDADIAWTVYEWDELGNPLESKEYAQFMLSYSPYHNIDAKSYPHMLITAGLNDPRVSYSEPAKFTAKLRRMKTDSNLLLLKTYLTGHVGASGRFDSFEELAFQYAFLIDRSSVGYGSTGAKAGRKVNSPLAITPPDLLSMFRGYQVTMVLNSALELGVFDALHQMQNFTSDCETLAKIMGVQKHALKRLLQSLVAVGLLIKEDDNYILTETSVNHLVRGMPAFLGDLRLTLANDKQWTAIRSLADSIKRPPPSEEILYKRDDIIQETLSLLPAYRHASAELLTTLSPWARRKNLNVLDLACGNGLLAYTLMQRHPKMRVWSCDVASALNSAKLLAEEMGVIDRVHYIETTDILNPENLTGGSYDVIIVGHDVLNILGTERATALLQLCSAVLKSTGRMVLFETVSGTDSSPHPHLRNISLFATGSPGKVHPLSWFEDILTETGFATPTLQDLYPFPEKLLISFRNIISRMLKGKK